jgi:hypothetical protein
MIHGRLDPTGQAPCAAAPERFAHRFSAERPVEPATPAQLDRCGQALGAPLPEGLRQFLLRRNGGTFEGGLLHMMGACRPFRHDDLATWNQPHDWKSAFGLHDLTRYVFFADDVFGNQFGYLPGVLDPAVWRFDIHVGELTELAPSLEAFFEQVLVDDGDWLLGGDLLRGYRDAGQALQAGQHLALLMPSLLGGSMEPENLRPVEPATNLYLAGQVLTRIKPLPPGTEVRGLRYDPVARQIHFETRAPRA